MRRMTLHPRRERERWVPQGSRVIWREKKAPFFFAERLQGKAECLFGRLARSKKWRQAKLGKKRWEDENVQKKK